MLQRSYHSEAEDVRFGCDFPPKCLWCHVRLRPHNPLCHHGGRCAFG